MDKLAVSGQFGTKDGRVALPILETLDFIKEGRNVVLYGNPGTGKTHIATGLRISACEQGYSVLFTSVPHLLIRLRECQSSKTLHALENCKIFGCLTRNYYLCNRFSIGILFN